MKDPKKLPAELQAAELPATYLEKRLFLGWGTRLALFGFGCLIAKSGIASIRFGLGGAAPSWAWVNLVSGCLQGLIATQLMLVAAKRERAVDGLAGALGLALPVALVVHLALGIWLGMTFGWSSLFLSVVLGQAVLLGYLGIDRLATRIALRLPEKPPLLEIADKGEGEDRR